MIETIVITRRALPPEPERGAGSQSGAGSPTSRCCTRPLETMSGTGSGHGPSDWQTDETMLREAPRLGDEVEVPSESRTSPLHRDDPRWLRFSMRLNLSLTMPWFVGSRAAGQPRLI